MKESVITAYDRCTFVARTNEVRKVKSNMDAAAVAAQLYLSVDTHYRVQFVRLMDRLYDLDLNDKILAELVFVRQELALLRKEV